MSVCKLLQIVVDIVRWHWYDYGNGCYKAVLKLRAEMTDTYEDLELMVPITVDADIEVDPHGVCNVIATIFVSDDDEGYEAKVPLEHVIDALIEEYRDTYAFNQLYIVAHELSRQAERLRAVGGTIEDSTIAVSDLFNVPDD